MFDIFLTLGFLISAEEYCKTVNPSMPNGISCPYHLNESFLVEGLLGDKFQSESIFKSSFCKQTVQNLIRRRIRLIFFHCFPMSHKKEPRCKWVNIHGTNM